MKHKRIKKTILFFSGISSMIFFVLSVSSLYVETDFLDSSFRTPWFSWQIDAMGVYFFTAMLFLFTARLAMAVFHKKDPEDFEALMIR